MAGTWRLAKSLEGLRDQVNALYPGRNKASDGTIGDARHAASGSASDHNPNREGVVTAIDITHDPAHGLDIEQLAKQLADSRDPRIKYIIFNRKIIVPSSSTGWKPYMGDNPHDKHIHVSVWGNYDDQTKWRIDSMDWKTKFLEAEKIANERLRALGIKDQEIADRDKRINELYALAEDRLKAIRIYEQKEKDGSDINTKLDRIIKKLEA